MNYLAHAYRWLDQPYRMAGVCFPDWLSARTRLRRLDSEAVERAGRGESADHDQFLEGVRIHLAEDARFHTAALFEAICREIAADLRKTVSSEPRFRASFWAHVMVELLLDAWLMVDDPARLDLFYSGLGEICPARVSEWGVDLLRPGTGLSDPPATVRDSRDSQDALGLEPWIQRFIELRFIAGYGSDLGLLERLAPVGRRIGLPSLPGSAEPVVARARRRVSEIAPALLGLAHAD